MRLLRRCEKDRESELAAAKARADVAEQKMAVVEGEMCKVVVDKQTMSHKLSDGENQITRLRAQVDELSAALRAVRARSEGIGDAYPCADTAQGWSQGADRGEWAPGVPQNDDQFSAEHASPMKHKCHCSIKIRAPDDDQLWR